MTGNAAAEYDDINLRQVFDFLRHQYFSSTTSSGSNLVRDTNLPEPESSTPSASSEFVRQIHVADSDGIQPSLKPLKNEFFQLNNLPGCDFLLNIVRSAQSAPIDNNISGK